MHNSISIFYHDIFQFGILYRSQLIIEINNLAAVCPQGLIITFFAPQSYEKYIIKLFVNIEAIIYDI